MYRLLFFCVALLSFFSVKANEVEIRYHFKDADKIEMLWGINDWQKVPQQPEGTKLQNKVMLSPMKKEGGYFVLRVNVPAASVIDYVFIVTKKEGPFKLQVKYWGMKGKDDQKYYHTKANDNSIVTIEPDKNFLKQDAYYPLKRYSQFLILGLILLSAGIFLVRKYALKKPAGHFDQRAMFASITATLLGSLFFVRAYTAQLVLPFLISPLTSFPVLLKSFLSDFNYVLILMAALGLLFFFFKRTRKGVLIAYGFLTLLSVLAALFNSKLIGTLGKPFNFQWLYYSDFLRSKDASNAMLANIDRDFIYGSILILLCLLPLGYIFYRICKSKPLSVPVAIVILFIIGGFSSQLNKVPLLSRVNPVTYFVQSLFQSNEVSIFSDKNLAASSELNNKNKDVSTAYYDSLFRKTPVKNVLVMVLESVPAEYITAFNPTLNATPFLDSVKNSSALFDAVYAHTPATNKSMVSFLCASYSDVTYQTITAEDPAIKLPSASSELKKYGYRTAFFNSGDNRYQNAEGFLKNRSFDVVEDYRNNKCDAAVFSDKRFKKDLDGIDDICLKSRLFDWINKEPAKPFFAMMWTFQTHYPYYFSGEPKDYGTGNPSLERYLNALHHADETIKEIVDELKKKNMLDSTLIVILGDHGEAFGRHNQTTHGAGIYDENLHIPLMFINPVLFKGEKINAVAGISDIVPSIFSVLNKPAATEWQGENLFSVNRREKVYFLSPYSDYLFGLRHGNFKFIFNASTNSAELYDLKTDPTETTNLADSKPELVKEYKMNAQAWLQYQSKYMQKISPASAKP